MAICRNCNRQIISNKAVRLDYYFCDMDCAQTYEETEVWQEVNQ